MNQETQMILRVPEDIATQINKIIDSKGDEEEFIEITPKIIKNQDNQSVTQFTFKFQDFESTASILELPCIIESHKTFDDVNIYKSGNISQMVYVHPNKEEFLEDCPNFNIIAKKDILLTRNNDEKVKYLARDGLTPPTKDIRNRFFRKEFPVVPKEIREVEKEMINILKDMRDKPEDSKKNMSLRSGQINFSKLFNHI